jgi:serine/threonine-protein kinase RsbT
MRSRHSMSRRVSPCSIGARLAGSPVGDRTRIGVESDADIVAARQAGRLLAEALGFSVTVGTFIATAISEVARNITAYSRRGSIVITALEEPGRRGIEIVATDEGPGIADVERAMQDGFSTSGGMGLGLPGARRLMDDFVVESTVGAGTTVTMRKWLPRREG